MHIYVCVCVRKRDLALNNLQWLICNKKQPTNQPPDQPTIQPTKSKPHLLNL